jgi:hypothetical protein
VLEELQGLGCDGLSSAAWRVGRVAGCGWICGFCLPSSRIFSIRRATRLLRSVDWPTSAGGARSPSSGSVVISSTSSTGSGLALWWAGGFGEVEAGDLEAVEEEAGAAGVDVVGGDALEDLADGVLDGGAVFGQGEFEGGAAGSAGVGYGFAGGVVVIGAKSQKEKG